MAGWTLMLIPQTAGVVRSYQLRRWHVRSAVLATLTVLLDEPEPWRIPGADPPRRRGYSVSSIVTATSAFADSRTVPSSTSATSPSEM